MTTRTITYHGAASLNAYARIFNASGQVFDFDDNSFKALSAATTPYVAMTERGDMNGTSFSGYTADVDLAEIHNGLDVRSYVARFYDNASPADADVALGDPLPFELQLGDFGRRRLVVQAEANVKSTAGNDAQICAWLESDGEKVDLPNIGGAVFTADAGTDFLTSAAHGLSNGDVVTLTSDTTIPAGLEAGTLYYVVNKTTNTFQVSLTSGGSEIDVTSTGTGSHKWRQPTATVTLREHSAAAVLFTKSLTAADFAEVSDVLTAIFEGEQSAPAFVDDRSYEMTATITVDGVAVSTTHRRIAIG